MLCSDDNKPWSCAGLADKPSYPRWLSLPGSRIVINPAQSVIFSAHRLLSESVPLNVAYYCGETPVRLPVLWTWEAAGSPFTATSFDWSPHQITVQAQTDDETAELRISTCFADADAIVQLASVQKAGAGSLVVKGRFPDGDAEWDANWNSAASEVTLQGDAFGVVLAVGKPARWLGCDSDGWALEISGLKTGDEIAVAARFAPGKTAIASIADLATPEAFKSAVDERERQWNALLDSVPHPADFSLHLVEREQTAEDIRRTYYRAWVFLLADILPPMPKNDFAYPQLACGKPSLWAEGCAKAMPSAQWESLIAMQMMALVDPETAWRAFEGLMSLVDAEGTLGGEGLPSRHAQTAWVLYSLTHETERLRSTYAAIKRMLLWKTSDPRWIYHGATAENSKDLEFVAHALLDMDYCTRICGVLDMPEEQEFWNSQIAELSAKMKEWFWEIPGGAAFEFYYADQDFREGGRDTWNLQALVLSLDILGEPQRDSLMKAYRFYLRDKPFLIPRLTKHPTYNFTMRGVWQYGSPEDVAKMAEAVMSAVTSAGEFAEEYGEWFPVDVSGVTPSVFGAANIIDACLWHNGILLGYGLPIPAHVPNAAGVKNLLILDKRFDVDVTPSGETAEFTCTVDGVGGWKRNLKIGEQARMYG